MVTVALLWLGTVRPIDDVSTTRQSLSKATTADWAFVAADLNLAPLWSGALPRPTVTPAPSVNVAVGRPPFALATAAPRAAAASGARRPPLVGVVEFRI